MVKTSSKRYFSAKSRGYYMYRRSLIADNVVFNSFQKECYYITEKSKQYQCNMSDLKNEIKIEVLSEGSLHGEDIGNTIKSIEKMEINKYYGLFVDGNTCVVCTGGAGEIPNPYLHDIFMTMEGFNVIKMKRKLLPVQLQSILYLWSHYLERSEKT